MTRQQLKLLRLYQGRTQADFAEEIGLTRGTLAKVEAGFSQISETTKAKVLRKYDLMDEGFLSFCKRMEG